MWILKLNCFSVLLHIYDPETNIITLYMSAWILNNSKYITYTNCYNKNMKYFVILLQIYCYRSELVLSFFFVINIVLRLKNLIIIIFYLFLFFLSSCLVSRFGSLKKERNIYMYKYIRIKSLLVIIDFFETLYTY